MSGATGPAALWLSSPDGGQRETVAAGGRRRDRGPGHRLATGRRSAAGDADRSRDRGSRPGGGRRLERDRGLRLPRPHDGQIRHGYDPCLVQSFSGGLLGEENFTDSETYDDALMIDAYLAQGTADGQARAEVIGNGLLYVQAHDPRRDGRIRAAYAPRR